MSPVPRARVHQAHLANADNPCVSGATPTFYEFFLIMVCGAFIAAFLLTLLPLSGTVRKVLVAAGPVAAIVGLLIKNPQGRRRWVGVPRGLRRARLARRSCAGLPDPQAVSPRGGRLAVVWVRPAALAALTQQLHRPSPGPACGNVTRPRAGHGPRRTFARPQSE
jgi:hypothetical protein